MSTPGTEAKLLVVDDEPNIRALLASSLRFAGFDVVTAEDGSGAFHEAQASRPDLIVLDVMLPDMDGFTVTRRLRDAGITDVDVVGLAESHCVACTAVDAARANFKTRVLRELTAPVTEELGASARQWMTSEHVEIV